MEAQAAELVSHGALTQGVGSPAAGFGEISVERDRLALGLQVEHAGGVWAEFAADSSLEGDGFEPSVPRRKRKVRSERKQGSCPATRRRGISPEAGGIRCERL